MGNPRQSSSSGGRRVRRAKRKYFGPKKSSEEPRPDDEAVLEAGVPESASARKLKNVPFWLLEGDIEQGFLTESDSESEIDEEQDDDDDDAADCCGVNGNRIVDLSSLQEFLDNFAICRKCSSGTLRLADSKKRGLGTVLTLECNACGYLGNAPLSKKAGRSFEVNKRSVLGMRRIGRGWNALRKFCGIMNLPPPVTESVYNTHHKQLMTAAVSNVAEKDMLQCAVELKQLDNTDKIAVTFAGTWMRRGYSSLFGVFACISWRTGRVLDVQVKSRYCHECALWNDEEERGVVTAQEFQEWKEQHYCKANTKASAPGMECEAASGVWKRSVEKRSLVYTTYIGDGDTKGYNRVYKEDSYGGVPIAKEECVGHVEKRVGTRHKLLPLHERYIFGVPILSVFSYFSTFRAISWSGLSYLIYESVDFLILHVKLQCICLLLESLC
eukprot:scpid72803/ scgid6114/ 